MLCSSFSLVFIHTKCSFILPLFPLFYFILFYFLFLLFIYLFFFVNGWVVRKVSSAPTSGSILVSPTTGGLSTGNLAASANFQVLATDWTTDPANLPLSYKVQVKYSDYHNLLVNQRSFKRKKTMTTGRRRKLCLQHLFFKIHVSLSMLLFCVSQFLSFFFHYLFFLCSF